MKTEPMAHQKVGGELLAANPEFFGLGAEQGTGKTWMLLEDAERQWREKRATGILVIAPKGVHTNWVRREIPTHLEIPVAADYYMSGAGKRRARNWEALMEKNDRWLAVFAINIDALNTPNGYKIAAQFLKAHDAVMIVDESSRIKNPGAARTKKAVKLGRLATSRRIASGTMMTQGPQDLFAQFEFLKENGALLGTTSFRAFVAEYCQTLPADNPIVVEAARKSGFSPQIIARDSEGRPIYKNLEKLRELMAPYVYRVLKADCLDLPPKVYQNHYFELPTAQRKVYESAKHELRYERDSGEIDKFTALTKLNKLRQITSGFIMLDGEATELPEDSARLSAFKDLIEDVDGQFIVWAVYREEIRQIVEALKAAGINAVEYHGGVKEKEREAAIDDFQNGVATAFVGNAQAGGIGLTLTAAQTAIYYSNDFSLELRLQSEDRCHRKGTKGTVRYIDLVAVDSIDEHVATSLQRKGEVADFVMNNL